MAVLQRTKTASRQLGRDLTRRVERAGDQSRRLMDMSGRFVRRHPVVSAGAAAGLLAGLAFGAYRVSRNGRQRG